jgi:NAD(P)-dependent dehydrogenase (short-subunit alcohol dehydrogenase family)
MTSGISRAVLITGCSSGIGRATALHLAARGWTVYATARRVESLTDLERAGCHVLPLDVTDEMSMEHAVRAVEEREGAVGVLINNAAYSQSGAFESISMDRVRRQFETNVFGLIRLTQLVLPGMRRQGWGKVVLLSSMGGRLTFPGGGYYHATKYAIEALGDALRFEVAGFGIDVILIEPGVTRSRFGDAAVASIDVPEDDAYAAFNRAVAENTRNAYERGPLVRLGGTPEDVASAIERAITSDRPRARYPVTPSAWIMMTLRRLLPDRWWDAFLRTQFPQPK